jgi:hypothetical protein
LILPQDVMHSGRLFHVAQFDVQLAQLLFVDRAGGLGQQALGTLGLGEGDHIADRLGTGHQRDDAVQPKGQATVGRCTVLQGVEQEAEFELRFFRA